MFLEFNLMSQKRQEVIKYLHKMFPAHYKMFPEHHEINVQRTPWIVPRTQRNILRTPWIVPRTSWNVPRAPRKVPWTPYKVLKWFNQ